MTGIQTRLRRILGLDGHALVVPIDHGVTLGPVQGLGDARSLVDQVSLGAPDAIVAHRGFFQQNIVTSPSTASILHLSGGTSLGPDSSHKALVASVEDAIRLAADAVSVHLSLGTEFEHTALEQLGQVASSCVRWDMPLLVMAYAYGPESETKVAHAARVAAELGADMVKVPYTGCADSFADVVEGCFVPVLVAGGDGSPAEVIEVVRSAMSVGGAGACVGRGVFNGADMLGTITELHSIIHCSSEMSTTTETLGSEASLL